MNRPVENTQTQTLPGDGAAGGEPAAGALIRLAGLSFDVSAFSEVGPRAENQDAYVVEAFRETGLIAVADGMGGEREGRLAADTALRALLDAGPIRSLDDARRAVRAADRAVAGAAQQDVQNRRGMGCALGLLTLSRAPADGALWIGAHVGDVRIVSRSPDGAVRLETRDHTPAFARWEAGEIELDSIPEAEGANRLQRAVGRGGEADAIWLPAYPGWSYCIISDGVTKAMRLDELGDALAAPSAAAACERMRRKVQERGADDNFTAVVVKISGEDAGHPQHSAATPGASPPPAADPVNARRPSAGNVILAVLALLALLAAGAAFWTAREAMQRGADRTEIERLRTQLDSLRLRVNQLEQPFGPALPTTPASTEP
jgi:serine/threonine protein phosphatase PrpC